MQRLRPRNRRRSVPELAPLLAECARFVVESLNLANACAALAAADAYGGAGEGVAALLELPGGMKAHCLGFVHANAAAVPPTWARARPA